ncbi:hypothetical protein AGMMS49587_09250 [Spirochaetia bacterium]|nr:hypothetical protein AGMMS49587_09250 [Spirochaetia bacterium]
MRKNQLWTIAAALLLTVSLVLAGCGEGAAAGGTGINTVISPDVVAANQTELDAFLSGSQFSKIGVGTFAITGTDVTVPSGKILILQGDLTFSGATTLIVDGGKVYVAYGASITPGTGSVEVTNGGNIEVLAEGSITLANAGEINDGTGATFAETVLGTSAVTVNAYGTLTYTGTIDDTGSTGPTLLQAWTAAGDGNLVITGATFAALTIDYDFSAITGGVNPTLNPDFTVVRSQHALTATAKTTSAATGVTIPAGVVLTAHASDTLGALESLTVNGVFKAGNASAALPVDGTLPVASVTGTGWLDLSSNTTGFAWTALPKIAKVSNSKALLVTGGATLADNQTVPEGMYLTAPAAAVTLADDKKLTVNGYFNVVNAGGLTLTGLTTGTAVTSEVDGSGTLIIGAGAQLAVTGGAANAQTSAGGTATLTVNVETKIVATGKLLATGGAGSTGSSGVAVGKGGGGATLVLQQDVTFAAAPASGTLLATGGIGVVKASSTDSGFGGGALITGGGHIKGPSGVVGTGTAVDVSSQTGGYVHTGTGVAAGAGSAAPGENGADGAGTSGNVDGLGGRAQITNAAI